MSPSSIPPRSCTTAQRWSILRTRVNECPYATIRGDNEPIEIGEGSLIGIQAVLFNGANIGRNCLIGAGALVTEDREIPDNSPVPGSPGKVVRTRNDADIAGMHSNTANYVRRGQHYKEALRRIA